MFDRIQQCRFPLWLGCNNLIFKNKISQYLPLQILFEYLSKLSSATPYSKKPAILQVYFIPSFSRSRDLGHNLNLIFGKFFILRFL